ncbi:hypothetical protein BDF22DRAFT_653659 [Syncephalis plumigaleata]|nr:hypothetical protein BDF22DRAFT_653659 [Syncephalis plumigaleata]
MVGAVNKRASKRGKRGKCGNISFNGSCVDMNIVISNRKKCTIQKFDIVFVVISFVYAVYYATMSTIKREKRGYILVSDACLVFHGHAALSLKEFSWSACAPGGLGSRGDAFWSTMASD